jgi:glycopeptide antibiotics resistance protein
MSIESLFYLVCLVRVVAVIVELDLFLLARPEAARQGHPHVLSITPL